MRDDLDHRREHLFELARTLAEPSVRQSEKVDVAARSQSIRGMPDLAAPDRAKIRGGVALTRCMSPAATRVSSSGCADTTIR